MNGTLHGNVTGEITDVVTGNALCGNQYSVLNGVFRRDRSWADPSTGLTMVHPMAAHLAERALAPAVAGAAAPRAGQRFPVHSRRI